MAMARRVTARWDKTTTSMATAIRATTLTMMAMTTTMATGDDNDDGDGVTGDDATGYDDGDDGDGRRRQ